jgi:surface antigen
VRLGKTYFALVAIIVVASVSEAVAENCVQFVKSSSTFELSGNAAEWWDRAAGVYERSNEPRTGSVLVFERTRRMPAGHVALVSRVVDDVTILIDHANWSTVGGGDGRVRKGVMAMDCSPSHDWSAVCVWNQEFGSFGRPYATAGFIYPERQRPALTTLR